jgi:L-iditol 2-dehydrogenase
MKALILKEYNRFLYEDAPEPQIGPDDVLVKVRACAICGSDVHGMDGSTGRRIPPVVMGHEASGVIEKTGDHVTGFRTGDRVTFDSTVSCGTCSFCRQGQVNLCDNRRVLGVSCAEYRMNGAFAQYVSVPQHVLYLLPDSVSFERAAMVEPLSIALHAIRRSAISLNCSAVVVGAGMIGLLVVQLLKAAGCGSVVAVDLEQQKLDMAGKFGADVMLKADDPELTPKILASTRGRGADVAFEAVGISASL